jgi:uncharacterized tellurite resistance protein B-like protein
MGLLSKLTGLATPKKPTDNVLLAQAMLLMAGADGCIETSEIATVEGFANTLPEFHEGDFGQTIAEAQKLIRKYPTHKESVAALRELSSPALRIKAFLLAADIALASGDVDEQEDALLESMQRVLAVDDATAQNIVQVLSLKYAK